MEKNKGIDKLSNKILEGVRQASKKLIERSAANNERLIIADENGNPISVPAKELLKNL